MTEFNAESEFQDGHICGPQCGPDCEHEDSHDHAGHNHDHDHNIDAVDSAFIAYSPGPELIPVDVALANGNSDIFDIGLDPSSGLSGLIGSQLNDKPIWSAFQTGAHIARAGTDWLRGGDMVVTYSFSDLENIGDGFFVFTQENQSWAEYVFDLYAEASGLTFVEVAADAPADLTLKSRGGTNGGGYWNGSDVVVGDVSWEPETKPGTYAMRLLMHEIGHALGLSHPGPYNGNGSTYADADHYNDSRQYTNLSYWSEGETGASFGHMSTLGLHDYVALHIEYGANYETRAGDDVYGFNQTTGLESYDLTYDTDMAFSIWDGAGIDTLDFSGSSDATHLDLREGAFSSVNGQINNISVAYNAVIENGVGSEFDDVLRGNSADNVLRGGAGNDMIRGGDEALRPEQVNPLNFTGIAMNIDPLTRDQYIGTSLTDALSGSEFTLSFSIQLARIPSDISALASYAVSGSSNELLIEADNGGLVSIYLNGVGFDTQFLTGDLIDGQPHHISLSWNSVTGALAFTIDDVTQETIHQAGSPLASGGMLIFGQEQDSVGGRFNDRQIFNGTVGDIQISNQDGLAHDWQVADTDILTITDLAGDADMSIFNGASVNDTTPDVPVVTDNDTIYGGQGGDGIWGGIGNDILYGDGELDYGADPEVFNLGVVDRAAGNRFSQDDIAFSATGDFTVEFLLDLEPDTGATYAINLPGFAIYRWIDDNDGRLALQFWDAEAGDGWNWSVIPQGSLSDGPGRFSVSYNDATGAVAVYVNGSEVWSRDYAPGNLNTRDSGDVSFNATGLVGDIRIFDAALDAQTIAQNALVSIASDTDNLVQYWQADEAGDFVQQVAGGDDLTSVGDPDAASGALWSRTFDDTLHGGAGDDTLIGSFGDDTLNGGDGADYLFGGQGADVLIGGAGRDRAYYSDAATGVTVNILDSAQNLGEAAGDTFSSIEAIYGSVHADRLTSGNDNNDLVGNDGNDVLIGAGGRDRLFGGDGDDRLLGGSGNDDLSGGAGADTFVIQAGAGADRIFNLEIGLDKIEYRDGPGSMVDLIIRQVGANTVIDTTVGSLRLMGVTAGDLSAADFIFLNPSDAPTGLTVTTDLDDGKNVFTGDANDDVVSGMAGNDTLRGGVGDDTLIGGEGNDTLRGGLGADILDGGDGIDRVDYSTAGTGVTINAINSALNTGEAAGDTYINIENFQGSNGNDSITSGSDGNILIGLNGQDTLIGAGGDDTLFGGNDDDRLLGGTGDDVLHGQQGEDVYVIQANAGNDDIYGFEDGLDLIEYNGTAANFADLTITQDESNVTIVWAGDISEILTVHDALAADFTADDFIFLNPAMSGQALSSKALGNALQASPAADDMDEFNSGYDVDAGVSDSADFLI